MNYIFEAILILFLVIFKDDLSGNLIRGDKSFRMSKRTRPRQSINYVILGRKEVKRAFLSINYLSFVKNTGNIILETCKSFTQIRPCALVRLHDLQLPHEILPIVLTKGGLISK